MDTHICSLQNGTDGYPHLLVFPYVRTPTDEPCPPEGAEGTPLTGLDWAVVNRDEPSFYFGRLFSHFITMVCMTELPFLEALPNLIQSSPIT